MMKSGKWPLALALLLLGSAIGLFAGMVIGGAVNAGKWFNLSPWLLWGVPAAKIAFEIAQALTIGGLVFMAFALSPKSPAFSRALSFIAFAAAVWAISGTAYLFLTYLNISGGLFSLDNTFFDQFWIFLTRHAWFSKFNSNSI